MYLLPTADEVQRSRVPLTRRAPVHVGSVQELKALGAHRKMPSLNLCFEAWSPVMSLTLTKNGTADLFVEDIFSLPYLARRDFVSTNV